MLSLQRLQFFNLFLLFIVGYTTAYIYLTLKSALLILFFSILFEHTMIYLRYRHITHFSVSALTTALGVMLMMATTHLWIYMAVIGLGLLQKHFLRFNDRHFFNPSNFALVMALLFFYKEAHMVLGQLGDSEWLAVIVVILGMIILAKAKRWVIPIVFTVSYLVLQYVLIVQNDPVMLFEDLAARFYSVSFIVFILFMLTDPRTTPGRWYMQAFFALAVALFATLLDYFYSFRVQHLFIALWGISAICMPFLTKQWNGRIVWLYIFVLLMVLSAIIYIQMQPPYYFEMNR